MFGVNFYEMEFYFIIMIGYEIIMGILREIIRKLSIRKERKCVWEMIKSINCIRYVVVEFGYWIFMVYFLCKFISNVSFWFYVWF